MKRRTFWIATIALFAMCSAGYGLWMITFEGTWPKTWPKELEALRKGATSLEGGLADQKMYQIPFTTRESFEAAWPHLVKVKSKGAPIILVRGPYVPYTGQKDGIKAGVIVHCPPGERVDNRTNPDAPIPGHKEPRQAWLWTNFIELIVDGEIVDLNRIALPPDTLIIDERFDENSWSRQATKRAETRPTTRQAAKPAKP